MKPYLTDKEIRAILKRGQVSLWRYRKAGKLPKPRKLNGQNLTPSEEAYAAIEAMLDEASTAA